jgi:hypothetical protein
MAWTTKTIAKLSPRHTFKRGDGRMLFCYALTCVSDTGASGDITLSTALETAYGAKESERLMEQMGTFSLYWINYVTGTATKEATITVDDELGLLLFSEAVTTAETSQGWIGTKDTVNAPMTDAIIACGALADAATKTATIYFWFIK